MSSITGAVGFFLLALGACFLIAPVSTAHDVAAVITIIREALR